MGKLPNTYAYSKNLTEQLVSSYSSKFPTVIARPSIGKTAHSDHNHLDRKIRVLLQTEHWSFLTPRWFWCSFITTENKTLWCCLLYKYQSTQNQQLLFTSFRTQWLPIKVVHSNSVHILYYLLVLNFSGWAVIGKCHTVRFEIHLEYLYQKVRGPR